MRFLPTCKEVHRITSEGMDRTLSLTERARIQVHLVVCTGCRNFGAQMQLMRRAMRKLPLAESDTPQREVK